ncbi:hypothetical protein PIB30_084534 [Stylosanthes scabra]|uniref:Putative plant transposon protein domain-containing protein n=1 Tax=Stylosanthes scabra TaxID=79078 RepID=A0ABU6WSE3_9FABA|nr:hypothetical protein [Stylosanthes scabra]
MALSSAPASVFDDYRFREEFNRTLFESSVRRKKVIPEVGFNVDEGEYPQIKEQIALRGWRRLAAPTTGISKLLVQEFHANAAVSDEKMENAGKLPYKSYVRGVEVDFSPENIRRVMRFKAETQGAETDYRTRQATDQRLNESINPRGTITLTHFYYLIRSGALAGGSSETPQGFRASVPIQLRMTELLPLARGWQEFIIHSLVPTEVRAEDIIADNKAVITQGLHVKGNLSFPSTIYKLCKDTGVPLREFKRTSRIPEEKLIMAKRMESTRLPRNVPQQQQDEDDEDEPMTQAGGGNEEDQEQ